MITLDLSILNQKGTPMFFSDLTANRPAAGIVGRIFIATDSPYGIFRDTGSAWDQVTGGTGLSGSGTATQVAFWNSTNSITGSNNLYWNSTSNFLGINTNTPGNALDVHSSSSSVAALNQTTATNNTLLALLNSGTPLWRIGNFYTSGANDFAIFDVVGALQQFTIVNTTGQTFIGTKTTASGRLVINSATNDSHLQIIGANSPSIRIDNAGSGGTQRFVIGNATATNNFIQGSTAGQFCITPASSAAVLFGMWQSVNATEVFRISTASNLLIGLTVDAGYKLDVNGTARVSGQITSITAFPNIRAFSTSASETAGYQAFVNNGSGNGAIFLAYPLGVGLGLGGNAAFGSTTSIVIYGNLSAASGGTTTIKLRPGGNDTPADALVAYQNSVSIGTTNIPVASAVLDVVSTTKGFLPPRMTTSQKTAISAVAGLVVYDTTLNKLCVYTTAWETITSV